MGLTKYSYFKFSILNIFASIIWGVVVGFASFKAGEYILSSADDFKYVGLGIVVVVLLGISYIFKKIDKKKK